MAEASDFSTQIVYLNGSYMPLSEARIPVLDRGFIFGDGIYEVVPVYEGHPFRLAHHLKRLKRSLAKIRITNPLDDAGWTQLIDELVRRHPQWPNQVVYMHITRGVAKRDHAFPENATPTVFAMTNPFTPPTLESIGEGLSVISVPDERWLHCDIKSISLLGNILARQTAVEAGAIEAVLFRDGYLTEGASSNIWVVKDGKLLAQDVGDGLREAGFVLAHDLQRKLHGELQRVDGRRLGRDGFVGQVLGVLGIGHLGVAMNGERESLPPSACTRADVKGWSGA